MKKLFDTNNSSLHFKINLAALLDTVVTCWARVSKGATYTQRASGFCVNMRSMANSAQMVFPLPVGAPMNMLSSLLYTELNTAQDKENTLLKPEKLEQKDMKLLQQVSWGTQIR